MYQSFESFKGTINNHYKNERVDDSTHTHIIQYILHRHQLYCNIIHLWLHTRVTPIKCLTKVQLFNQSMIIDSRYHSYVHTFLHTISKNSLFIIDAIMQSVQLRNRRNYENTMTDLSVTANQITVRVIRFNYPTCLLQKRDVNITLVDVIRLRHHLLCYVANGLNCNIR